jgi:cell wall-associated NlpC family hydrolase
VTCRPLPVRRPKTTFSVAHRLRRNATALLIVFAAACLGVAAASAEPPGIVAKKAEVQQVLAEINNLDASLERAVEAYNASTAKLQGIEHQQAVNRNELRIAKRNLKREQTALARRLVAIYTSDADTSTLGVLLGATSLDDLVNRVDTVRSVSDQDARVVRQVRQFKRTIARQKVELAHAHSRQATVVQQRADARASIESQLAERRNLVASIRSEIVKMQAEERARQARLEAEARRRLAALEAARNARVQAASEASTPPSSSISTDEVGVVASVPETTVAPPSHYGGVVAIAMQYLGVPYVWGGASPSGFDCSGLIVYVYAQVGVSLPHYTGALWNVGTPVSADQLEPGDLVFFNGLGHAGIYIGGGQFIHAPHTGDVVKISSMSDSWYAATYDGARRIL